MGGEGEEEREGKEVGVVGIGDRRREEYGYGMAGDASKLRARRKGVRQGRWRRMRHAGGRTSFVEVAYAVVLVAGEQGAVGVAEAFKEEPATTHNTATTNRNETRRRGHIQGH